MSDEMVTVRLRRDHAKFLEANLTRMAEHTRDAMKPPRLTKERRDALYNRAILPEHIDDAICGAHAEGDLASEAGTRRRLKRAELGACAISAPCHWVSRRL